MSKNTFPKTESWLFYVLLSFIMTCAAFIHWDRAVYSDLAWLIYGAELLLNGGNFVNDFYETNPPFNTIFYIPVILIKNFTGLNYNNASLLYIFPITFIASALISLNIRQHPIFRTNSLLFHYSILMFFMAGFIFATDQIGQRDIFAGYGTLLVLSAFYRYYLSSYKSYKKQPIIWASIIIGTILTFLKPHWGLLIIAGFIYRAYKDRRLSVIFDFDFLLISFLTASYIYLSLFFYPDWFQHVFYYVAKVYTTNSPLIYLKNIMAICISLLACAVISYFGAKEFKISDQFLRLIEFFLVLAALSLIPVFAQNKGLMYHFYLCFFFIIMSLFTLLYGIVDKHIAKAKNNIFICYSFIFILTTFISFHASANMYKVEDFKRNILFKKVQEYSDKGDSYFIFHENMGLIFPINLYVDREYGSRFASFWFIANLFSEADTETVEQRKYFGELMAEDLKRFKPQVYIAQRYHFKKDDKEQIFDLEKFFGVSPSFKTEFSKYKAVDYIKVNRKYMISVAPQDQLKQDFIEYDIYVRQKD